MDIDELATEIRQGVAAAAYLFYGPERFLVETAATEAVDALLGDALRDFNFDRFYGKGCDAEAVVMALRSLPMMAPRRVVLLRDAQQLHAGAQETLAAYLDDPVDSAALVLVADKVDLRKKLFKRARKVGRALEFRKLYPRQVPAWVRRMAKAEGKGIDADAVDALARLVGTDLSLLRSEVGKAALYAGDAPAITAEHVGAVVVDIRQDTIFELTDAVAERRADRALGILSKMMEGGERGLGILAMIWRHLRILALAKDALGRGGTAAEVFRTMGVREFLFDKYGRQVRGFSGRELESAYLAIRDTEFALKSSRLPDRLVLERLLMDLCTVKAPPMPLPLN